MTPYKTGLFLAFCGLLLLSACEKNEELSSTAFPVVHGPPVRIGVVPALTATETIRQYQPVVDYLNRRLGLDARLLPQKDYLTVLEKMRGSELDAGILDSLLCYRAIKGIGALPLARPEIGGDST